MKFKRFKKFKFDRDLALQAIVNIGVVLVGGSALDVAITGRIDMAVIGLFLCGIVLILCASLRKMK